MKTIERFDGRVGRVAKNSKLIYDVLKLGAKEALKKVNPALIVMDAVISLVDLGISYMNYKREKEIYKVLVKELETIKYEYESKRKIIEENLKGFEVEIDFVSEKFIDEMKKEIEILRTYNDTIIQLKESLIILKDVYNDNQEKEYLEKVIAVQNLFIELLIK